MPLSMTFDATGRLRFEDLGSLRGGYVPSAADRDRPAQGRQRALQARDLAPDGSIPWATLSPVAPVRDGDRYAVREGDVLLPLRSARMRAAVARGVPQGVIATGHWMVLTLAPKLASPEFVAWYLNHPTTKVRLNGLMSGGSLMFIPLSAIRDLEIDLPPLTVQHRIVRAHSLQEWVANLEEQIARARAQLVDTLTMDALNRAFSSHDANS